jgi:hypothetical protein
MVIKAKKITKCIPHLYACVSCEKTFAGRSGLYQHVQNVHVGMKQKCEFCEKVLIGNYYVRQKHLLFCKGKPKKTVSYCLLNTQLFCLTTLTYPAHAVIIIQRLIKLLRAKSINDSVKSSTISELLTELDDHLVIWSILKGIGQQIDKQKEKQWLTVEPRKLRTILNGLLSQMDNMPDRLRQYELYNHVKRVIPDYLKANLLMVELKSEALKERHWKQLMKRMNVVWNLNDLTF